MNLSRSTLVACLVWCASTGLAGAQVPAPAPLKWGGVDVFPVLEFEERYDDNLYRQDNQERASLITVVSPAVEAVALKGPNRYRLEYEAEIGWFHSSSQDNYADHLVSAEGHWEPSSHHSFGLAAHYRWDHDRRGTEYFEGDEAFRIDEPDRYENASVRGWFGLGNRETPGRIELEVVASDRTYKNNFESVRQRDRQNVVAVGTFYWRISGATDPLFEAAHGWTDYDSEPAARLGIKDSLSSTSDRYLVGLTWRFAGKTSGTLKAGYARKSFDDTDRQDFSGMSWSGELVWTPRSYSTLSLASGRRTRESTGRGDFVKSDDWELAWRHEWSERVVSKFKARFSDEDYVNDPRGRRDDEFLTGLAGDYFVRRWLRMGVFWTFEERDSSLERLSFTRNIVGVSIGASL